MIIKSIKLRNFRNYEALELRPHEGVNILFGQNGSGKTNLLEAIHYTALGRSHRTSLDREVVRKNAVCALLNVQLEKKSERMDVGVQLTPDQPKKKTVLIDGKRAPRLSELMGRVQCVIFSPEDLMLIKEGPSHRRRFLDMMLSQLSTAYFIALQQYQKALEQRNAILRAEKKGEACDIGMLDAFEAALAAPCSVIIPYRRRMSLRLAAIAAEKYASISGRAHEPFQVNYQCCLENDWDIAGQIMRQLRQFRQKDIQRGATSFGIHREDLQLTLSGQEMKLFASQGQIRTAALSMKLAQLDVLRTESGEAPILLLDDVMSELDMSRRVHLLQEISDVQTFITCTDASDLEGCYDQRSYRVCTDEQHLAHIVQASTGAAETSAISTLEAMDELE